MVRTCPSTMAPPSASASGATSATKTLNIFLESSSPTAETITAKAVGLGTEVFEASTIATRLLRHRCFRIPWFHQLRARTSKARVFRSGADTLQVERDDGRRDSETSRDMPGNVSPRISSFHEDSISNFLSRLPPTCSARPGAL